MIIGSGQTALLLLREATTSGTRTNASVVDAQDLLLAANGQASKSGEFEEAGEASQALFSVNATNLTKAKLELIDRTAEALGVKRDDFAEDKDFVSAMRDALSKLRRDGGEQAVLALEKKLGLDELGLKIADVIASASDPGREDKVTEALKLKLGILSDTDAGDDETGRGLVVVDSVGIYRIRSV